MRVRLTALGRRDTHMGLPDSTMAAEGASSTGTRRTTAPRPQQGTGMQPSVEMDRHPQPNRPPQ
jgi:hypothetical protein